MVGYITIPGFKISFITIVIKLYHKNRETGQWSRAENPYISSPSLSLLTFNQEASNTGSGIMAEQVEHLDHRWSMKTMIHCFPGTAGQLHM